MSTEIKKLQGNDAFQRMNYLYQISQFTVDKSICLSAYYGNLITSIAKKNVLKIHPEVKRVFCKKCHVALVDNVSATIKIKTMKKNKFFIVTCKICSKQKRLPLKNRNYEIWLEKPEAVLEDIYYEPQIENIEISEINTTS